MIVGGTSSTGRGLGQYLTEEKNERAEVWDIRGSNFPDLPEAVSEMRIRGLGTHAEKSLYHAWLAPSETDRDFAREDWEKAIAIFEKEMGFENQPRAVVYHHGKDENEKGHVHLVYSRIKDGKAISDSWNYIHHEKARAEMEKELNLEHVYSPHLDRDEKRHAQGLDENAKEQAKRLKIDPKEIKAEVSQIYQSADSGRSFVAGLEEAGYTLAQGDQRGYVILDQAGGVHSLTRASGAKAAELRERLKDYPLENLPTVEAAREPIRERQREHQAAAIAATAEQLKAKQEREREQLQEKHTEARAATAESMKQKDNMRRRFDETIQEARDERKAKRSARLGAKLYGRGDMASQQRDALRDNAERKRHADQQRREQERQPKHEAGRERYAQTVRERQERREQEQRERLEIRQFKERQRAGVVDPERDKAAARLILPEQLEKVKQQTTHTAQQQEEQRQREQAERQKRNPQTAAHATAQGKELNEREQREAERQEKIARYMRQMTESENQHRMEQSRGGGGRTRDR